MNVRLAPARRLLMDQRPMPDQAAAEALFFRALRHPNGTFKTTYPGRLAALDAAILDHLPPGEAVEALDVGISSGVTTLELLRSIEASGRSCSLTAVDLTIHGWLRRLGPLDLLYASDGALLQIAAFGAARCRPHDPAGSWLRAAATGVFDTIGPMFVGRSKERVSLVISGLQRHPGVTLLEHDLTKPRAEWPARFTLVRAANILHLDYFSPAEVQAIARLLHGYLREGGLLAICRTNEAHENAGTLFRRSGARLSAVQRIGAGAGEEDLILSALDPAR